MCEMESLVIINKQNPRDVTPISSDLNIDTLPFKIGEITDGVANFARIKLLSPKLDGIRTRKRWLFIFSMNDGQLKVRCAEIDHASYEASLH